MYAFYHYSLVEKHFYTMPIYLPTIVYDIVLYLIICYTVCVNGLFCVLAVLYSYNIYVCNVYVTMCCLRKLYGYIHVSR